ncbi:hypothetical protein ACFL6G_05945 [candidate division KSB1 bacterium]
MNEFFKIAIPALIGGVTASIIAPLIKWGIEKKRNKMEYRRNQIKRWRDFIHNEFEQLNFKDTTIYSELRPHLSKKVLENTEGNTITILEGRGCNVIKSMILDDIARLEKEWDLI